MRRVRHGGMKNGTQIPQKQLICAGFISVIHLFQRHQRPIFRAVLHALSCATGDKKQTADGTSQSPIPNPQSLFFMAEITCELD